MFFFFFSSRRRHTRFTSDWSSDVCSSDLDEVVPHIHSKILFQEAKVIKESVFIDEAMHNNLYDFGIEKQVISFTLKVWK